MRNSRRLTQAIVDKMDLRPRDGELTGFERLVNHVCVLLEDGDPWIIREFWDRIEGKPRAIAVEDAMDFARHLVESVRRHVTDPITLSQISKDMQSVYQWKSLLSETTEKKTPKGETDVGIADPLDKDPIVKKLCKPTPKGDIELRGRPKAWDDWEPKQ